MQQNPLHMDPAPLLARELVQLDGDIVCLQECSQDAFVSFLSPLLSVYNYDGFISVKTNASRVIEGPALFFKRNKYAVLQRESKTLSKELLENEMFTDLRASLNSKWPNLLAEVMPKLGTMVQLAALRDKQNPKNIIVVANTHLFFHPNASHVRIIQVYVLCHLVAAFAAAAASAAAAAAADVSIILCGDLNCDEESGGFTLLNDAFISKRHPDWKYAATYSWNAETASECEEAAEDAAAAATPAAGGSAEAAGGAAGAAAEVEGLDLELPVSVHLKSSYATTFMPFSNFAADFHATLDHIFVSKNIQVLRTLPGVSLETVASEGGILSAFFASDHLSLAADLQINKPNLI
ncbi:endonuclease/exonuclease/phosphatase domain-containing protein, putative [Eimeria acervulina]|uniref:Endonuclease/exonuclease/phosphatase domain-containing protein, putative n=1 Tax=Eimeria acervulina TaxID=5801 RepID=U6GF42_EIMAC|nr:endonuclease/exonuclease/phosphatase domain-containing protein, putative [Eimeria acervulina]CDI78142.1 endonuclease/exonuclease/phosphatase domain-containing protein, putative [Eimeria acervulina]